MAKKTLNLWLDEQVIDDFQRVAAAAHMSAPAYGAVVISRMADLKQEFALHAITAIPKDFFKGRPGRPPTAARDTDASSPAVA